MVISTIKTEQHAFSDPQVILSRLCTFSVTWFSFTSSITFASVQITSDTQLDIVLNPATTVQVCIAAHAYWEYGYLPIVNMQQWCQWCVPP